MLMCFTKGKVSKLHIVRRIMGAHTEGPPLLVEPELQDLLCQQGLVAIFLIAY